jgi:hypothetical protein
MLRRNASVLVSALVMAAGTLVGAPAAVGQVATSVGFQGQLKSSGTNVNTPADFRFSLWDAATGGNQVGTSDTHLAVPVADGLFNSSFDCGVDPYTQNSSSWLQIEVRTPTNADPNAPGFVVLGGRQQLSASPYSLATRGMTVDQNGYPTFPANAATFGNGTIGVYLVLDDIPGAKWAIGTAGYQFSLLSDGSGSYQQVFAVNPNGDTSILGGLGVAHDVGLSGNLSVHGTSTLTGDSTVGGSLVVGGVNGLDINSDFQSHQSIGLRINGVNSHGTIMSFEQSGVSAWGVGIVAGSTQLSFLPNRYPGGPNNAPTVVMDYNGSVGIGTTALSTSFKLDVAGNIRCVALTQTSSREFKQDIAPLTDALDSVMKLRGVSYRWNDKAPSDVQGKRDIGFIADEMNDVLPDIVAKDDAGKPVGIDYGKVAAVEVEAIKQLKAENDKVKADNADLKARLEKIEAILAAQARTAAK